MFKVEFIAMHDTTLYRWTSTDKFDDKLAAMLMAQTIVRNSQNSPFTIYYKILPA